MIVQSSKKYILIWITDNIKRPFHKKGSAIQVEYYIMALISVTGDNPKIIYKEINEKGNRKTK